MLKKYDLNESEQLGLYRKTYVKKTWKREELLGAVIQCSAVLIHFKPWWCPEPLPAETTTVEFSHLSSLDVQVFLLVTTWWTVLTRISFWK